MSGHGSSASMAHPVSSHPLPGRGTLLYLAVVVNATEAWCMMRSGPAIDPTFSLPFHRHPVWGRIAQRSLVLMCLSEIVAWRHPYSGARNTPSPSPGHHKWIL